MTADKLSHVDIIIAGGGLSGATMALALSQLTQSNGQPLNIAIVEPNPINEGQTSPSFDDRVLALSYGSACYFNELGLWSQLSSQATAINEIHVSDLGHYGKARLYAGDYDVSALGFVIEMRVLGQALIKYLTQLPSISWVNETQITHIDYQQTSVETTLANGVQLNGKLLLGCDGAQSGVRQLSKIAVSQKDYQQCAVIANVTTEKPHFGKAFERFTEDGPLAMLPMTDGRCSLVWTQTPEQAQATMELSDDAFCEQLTQRFGHWLGAVSHAGKRDCFPLYLVLANEQIRHRMALVGNASHTMHPIAGQGFNLGVRDIKLLASLINQQIAQHGDLGDFAMLMDYDQQRRADQRQVAQLTDAMVHIFSNRFLPTTIGRNVGLKLFNYLPRLKSHLAHKTMGLADD